MEQRTKFYEEVMAKKRSDNRWRLLTGIIIILTLLMSITMITIGLKGLFSMVSVQELGDELTRDPGKMSSEVLGEET